MANASLEVIQMDPEKEKAFDEKVKCFDKWLIGIVMNIGVSMLTTMILLERLGLLR